MIPDLRREKLKSTAQSLKSRSLGVDPTQYIRRALRNGVFYPLIGEVVADFHTPPLLTLTLVAQVIYIHTQEDTNKHVHRYLYRHTHTCSHIQFIYLFIFIYTYRK